MKYLSLTKNISTKGQHPGKDSHKSEMSKQNPINASECLENKIKKDI